MLSPSLGNPVQGFPGSTGPRTAKTRRSGLSINRFSAEGHGDVPISVPAEDSFLVIYQLRDHPSHDFWIDGKYRRAPTAPKGSLNIVDLSENASALLKHPVDSLILHMPRGVLDDLAEDAGAPAIRNLSAPLSWATHDPVLRDMQPLLLSVLSKSEAGNQLLADHLILAAGAHVAQAYGDMKPVAHRHGALAPWQERRAKELIAANLTEGISLAEIAQVCRLSLAYFARAFKSSTGMTPHKWLEARRIEKARDLLLKSDASLAAIAIQCGFADQSHFTRMFKREAGATPASWQRLHLVR